MAIVRADVANVAEGQELELVLDAFQAGAAERREGWRVQFVTVESEAGTVKR